jgi:hypothetical protein
MRVIGTLAEKSLHAALKARYAQPGDSLECDLGGYVIDIVRGLPDSCTCIEIQTGSFSSMKPKLAALLPRYPIRVVYPIPLERHIVRIDADGVIVSRRKSPRRGTVYHLFPELVSFPALVNHPNLSLEILLVRDEEIWVDDGRGSWRRKRWSIRDRRLIDVMETILLATPADFAALLPADLALTFDTGELARVLRQPRPLARKMAYCLRAMGVLEVVEMRGKAYVYRLAETITPDLPGAGETL